MRWRNPCPPSFREYPKVFSQAGSLRKMRRMYVMNSRSSEACREKEKEKKGSKDDSDSLMQMLNNKIKRMNEKCEK